LTKQKKMNDQQPQSPGPQKVAGLVSQEESLVLSRSAASGQTEAFASEPVNAFARSKALAGKNPEDALESILIIPNLSTPLLNALFEGFAAGLPVPHLAHIAEIRANLIAPLLRFRPEVAEYGTFWQILSSNQSLALQVVSQANLTDLSRGRVLEAIIDSGADFDAKSLEAVFGHSLLDHVLARIDQEDLRTKWLDFILSRPTEVAEWIHREAPHSDVIESASLLSEALTRLDPAAVASWSMQSWENIVEIQSGKEARRLFANGILIAATKEGNAQPALAQMLRRPDFWEHGTSTFDKLLAARLLVQVWAPDQFIESYSSRRDLAEALEFVKRAASFKSPMKRLKAFAKSNVHGWQRDTIKKVL